MERRAAGWEVRIHTTKPHAILVSGMGKVDQLDQTPRRAFLFMPLAFAGLVALWYRLERPLDDPRQNGGGRD
jgi:hypothetical protein